MSYAQRKLHLHELYKTY